MKGISSLDGSAGEDTSWKKGGKRKERPDFLIAGSLQASNEMCL